MVIYETCTELHGDDALRVVQCVANWIETEKYSSTNSSNDISTLANTDHYATLNDEIHRWLLLLTGALVFFMQCGFAMICAGAIRKKNVKNTMLKNLLDACGAGLAFYAVGYGLAYGDDNVSSTGATTTFSGTNNFFLSGDNIDNAFFFYQYTFSATCVTIIAGTLAERCRMASYFAYSLYLTGFVYPIVVHSIWSSSGFLSPSNMDAIVGMGMIDFAGSGVVHMTGGCTALYATYILGPRQGRFYDRHGNALSKPGLAKGQSVALQLLGTFILFFGWFGFNPGSALLLAVENRGKIAALAAVNTTLSAAAGTISALFTYGFIQYRRIGEFELDLIMAMNGCLIGLVAVTAGCAVVESWAAIVIGIVAGWVYIVLDYLLIRFNLDDAVAAIQVHLGGGLWGVIATGVLASPRHMLSAYGDDKHPGFFYSPSQSLLPAQLTGILCIICWTFVTTVPFFYCLDFFGLFRVNALEELVGLDMTYLHQEVVPSDDEREDSEEVRLAAYRQRFAERKKLREQIATVERSGLSRFDNLSNSFSTSADVPKRGSSNNVTNTESNLPKESHPKRNYRRDDDELSHQGSLHSA